MRKYLLAVLAVIGFSSVFGQGQTTASMNGRIVDENGEALIGATVVALHNPSGTEYGAVSNVDGIYRIPNMRIGGPYTIKVSYVGFGDVSKNNVYLALGQSFAFNAALAEDAQLLGSVTVTANPNDIFDGNKTGAESNIDENLVMTMPTAARNISDLTRLTPQAIITGDNNISIAGTNNRFNTFFIDGANNTDAFGLEGSGTNGVGGAPPISLDAIEQFSVSIAPYDVTLGGFTGGGVNAVTRSGTNDFQGSAYYFTRNESLAGRDPSDIPGDDRELLEDFTARTYGFRLGGPIIKNKLFFFVNGELQRDETPQANFFADYLGDATREDLN
ncbi:MAG: carboxypeptidase regulatory-like domain-containing protein, partial [Bacteroidota bacterium]